MDSVDVINVIGHALDAEIEALKTMKSSLSVSQIESTVKTINNCGGKVLLSGCGTSAMAAKKIAHSLCCIDIPAAFQFMADWA